MSKPAETDAAGNSDRDTLDRFIGWLPLDEHRGVCFYRRTHRGKQYVRWRVWHRHRTKHVWYPDRWRSFIIPAEHAQAMGRIIAQGSDTVEPSTEMPAWMTTMMQTRAEIASMLKAVGTNKPSGRMRRGMGEMTKRRTKAASKHPARPSPASQRRR